MDDLLAFAPVGKLQLDGEISCMAVLSERTFFVGFESGVVQFWEPESNSHSGFLPCPYRSKWSIFFTEKGLYFSQKLKKKKDRERGVGEVDCLKRTFYLI